VELVEADSRWGIAEEESTRTETLKLCLDEIRACRPFFIGLLGERYGWTPDTIRPKVIEREPCLKEHVQGRTSVAELEILHGVLNNPKMADVEINSVYVTGPIANRPSPRHDARRCALRGAGRALILTHRTFSPRSSCCPSTTCKNRLCYHLCYFCH
jgi:hypothetical protein